MIPSIRQLTFAIAAISLMAVIVGLQTHRDPAALVARLDLAGFAGADTPESLAAASAPLASELTIAASGPSADRPPVPAPEPEVELSGQVDGRWLAPTSNRRQSTGGHAFFAWNSFAATGLSGLGLPSGAATFAGTARHGSTFAAPAVAVSTQPMATLDMAAFRHTKAAVPFAIVQQTPVRPVPRVAGSNLLVGYSGGNTDGNPYDISSGSQQWASVYDGLDQTGTIYQTGGSLSASGSLFLSYEEGRGTYYLSGGALSVAAGETIGYGSPGTFNQSGSSTHTVTGTLYIGEYYTPDANSTYNLSSGTLSASSEVLGDYVGGVFNQSGGSNTVYGTLYLGYRNDSSYGEGQYYLSGGTLQVNAIVKGSSSSNYGYLYFEGGTLQAGADSTTFMQGLTAADDDSAAYINTNGYNITIAQAIVDNDGGSASLTKSGAGTLTLTGSNTYGGGTTFAGGTLNVGSAGALNSSGTLSFTGGTLQYSSANTTDYSSRFSSAAGQAYSVDTNSQSVTFATALTSSGGSLTKLGAGTLTLSATNSYSGFTAINGGTLTVSGNLSQTNAISVNNSGTLLLSGSGTDHLNNAAALTIASGGVFNTGGLSEGSSATGSSAGIGALTLTGGGSLDFGSGNPGATVLAASGLISGTGTFSILHWTGTSTTDLGLSTNDRLLFVGNPGFTAAQLAQVEFYSQAGTALGTAEEISYHGFTELVPVPEPATWLAGLLTFALAGCSQRHRMRALLSRLA